MKFKKITLLFLLLFAANSLFSQRFTIGEKMNDHIYVDLGLPSGTLWGKTNIGSSHPSARGNYFAWGEIETKSSYNEQNKKSVPLSNISSNKNYDAAKALWGGNWRIPTAKDFDELMYNCKWEWIDYDGVRGYLITGPNGNNIFLPAFGKASDDRVMYAGFGGYYWTSETNKNNQKKADILMFGAKAQSFLTMDKFDGAQIRPVASKKQEINGHEYIDLGLPSGLKWAKVNIGAKAPIEIGDEFAWGEIKTKDAYKEANCLNCGRQMADYSGNPRYDAATANWGGTWRTPTAEEYSELLKYCKKEFTEKGWALIGPNGARIFFPFGGFLKHRGNFLTSTPQVGKGFPNKYAQTLFITEKYLTLDDDYRQDGNMVRAVSN